MGISDETTRRMPRPRRRSGPVRHRFITAADLRPGRMSWEDLERQVDRHRRLMGIEARLDGLPRPTDDVAGTAWDATDLAIRLGTIGRAR
jgi:hypothetical protein